MEEFEEQARIRQQNREKARQANEESKRQFEEHMRFLRERRFGFDHDIDEYGEVFRERMAREQAEQDRLMLERLQAMALADLSQREMQKEFGRICQPIDEQQSAVNSAEGLLINWLNRFSDKAGFSDGVTVSQYNSTFGNRQKIQTHCERLEFEAQIFREKISAFYDTLQEAKIPPAYENWFSSVIVSCGGCQFF